MGAQSGGETPLFYRYRFGTAELDEARFELRVAGQVVETQRRPLEVLALLLQRAGEVVTRQELQEGIWNNRPTVDNVIDAAVSKLRAALGDENGARILTQPRVGFRLTGPVERVAVGRHFSGTLHLRPGGSVPRRENFVLDRRLGYSSRHEVWLARHAKTGELRVYKFSADGEGLAALKREATLSRVLRETLGERSDFVRIIDWNFDEPPFFLECEYGGENLLEWAGAHLAGLSLEKRLELFVHATDAVAAAHSVGVLHKDLKPANLLIDAGEAGPRVRVTDFGSARLLEPNRLAGLGITQLGLTVTQGVMSDVGAATALYVSPERLAGSAATAQSDVFALGILLYQLTIGDLRRPMVSGWEREVADEILREDIARATDGDPAMRLASAAELANRLRRLGERRVERGNHQAALKQAQLDRERLSRARARRPWLVATFAALSVGLLSVLWLYARIGEAQRALSRQFANASALNTFLTNDFIAVANPTVTGRKDVTVIEATRKAAADIDRAFASTEVRGTLHAAMQESFAGLSEFDASAQEGVKALLALTASDQPDVRRIIEVRTRLAATLARSAKLAEASSQLEAAAALIKGARLEDSSLAARYWWARGSVEVDRLALPQALEYDRRAWMLAQHSRDLQADTREQIQFSYADTLKMSSRFAEAEKIADDLLSQQRARLGPRHPQACYTQLLLASDLGFMQRVADGITLAQQASACLLERLGSSNIRVASGYQVLADLQFQGEHYADAARSYREAAERFTTLIGPQALPSIMQRLNGGVARQYAGEAAEAEEELSSDLQISRAALGWDSPTTQSLRYHLAACRLDQHKTLGVKELVDGLSATALEEAQIETDWEGRLSFERGRLALYSGDREHALPLLQVAAAARAKDPLNWRVDAASVARLIQDASPGRSQF